MSSVYNPQADLIAEIERLERQAGEIRARIDSARTPTDRKVLTEQLRDVELVIESMQSRLN